MQSTVSKQPLATLIVDGKLICLPAANLDDLFEDLIGRELKETEFLKGRSYLFEALPPQHNNLYSQLSASSVEEASPPGEIGQAMV